MSVTDLTDNVSKDLPTELVGNTVLDFGDSALMLQCGSTAEVLAWAAQLRAAALPGVVDIVPAARTVLVKLDGPRFQGWSVSACARCGSPPRRPPLLIGVPTWSSTSSTTAPTSPGRRPPG